MIAPTEPLTGLMGVVVTGLGGGCLNVSEDEETSHGYHDVERTFTCQ